MVVDVESKNYKNLKLVRNPINYSEEGIKGDFTEPPAMNENSKEVLEGILNYEKEKIELLK